jgi:hypothetical protein
VQTLTQSALSTMYVQALVQVTAAESYDPSRDSLAWAFVNANAFPAQQPGTWSTGSWDVWPGAQYWAQVLIGPENGGVVLSTGRWQALLKITDDPEVPVLQPFVLQITP